MRDVTPFGVPAGLVLGWRRIKRSNAMPPALRLRSTCTSPDPPGGLRSLGDGELFALVREGNADAFEVIYDRHSGVAFSLACRICGARGDAEDVVQTAFLSLWRGRDRYTPARGEVRSWLLRIVHNSAIDRLRHRGVHERRRASSEGIEQRLEAPERTDEDVEAREQASKVRQALLTLPGEQRQVIELAYFDGFTHAQIAAKLEKPVGTVKGRMRLGLLKLRAELADVALAPAQMGGPTP
jgi:RNA polymerase sigma-70 factor (ECF subfamily)